MNIPFVLPIQTALGYYLYDANRNQILSTDKDMYQCICKMLDSGQDSVTNESDAISKEFKWIQECGYLLPCATETILHPATSEMNYLLNRSMGNLILQVTQNCNLRCKYCIYSENSNLSQRSHSSNVTSFETAKRAIDFYRRKVADTDKVSFGFYGGEPFCS